MQKATLSRVVVTEIEIGRRAEEGSDRRGHPGARGHLHELAAIEVNPSSLACHGYSPVLAIWSFRVLVVV